MVKHRTVPYNFHPRTSQLALWRAMAPRRFDPGSHDRAFKRAVVVAHRRFGKDKNALNFLIDQSAGASARVGVYYYFYPYANQARKAIWEGIDRDGFKYMHHFPGFEEPEAEDSVVLSKRDTDMFVQLRHPVERDRSGSVFQIIGTDNYDSIRSTNPVGCIFSEYADQDPGAWDVVKPILRENGGWAIFVSTPKGANHFKKLYDMAALDGDWFTQFLTIDDTFRDSAPELAAANGARLPIFSRADYEKELAEGMDEEFARQEYYCAFSGNVVGSYYGRMLDRFKENIRAVPWEPKRSVHVAFDLGVDDMMTLWFFQLPDGPEGQVRIIEYLEGRNEGLSFYAREMRERQYIYGTIILPHDAEKRNPAERTPQQHMESLGFTTVIVPKSNPVAGIDTARAVLPRTVFDAGKTERGIACLRNYRKNLDPKKDTFGKPVHDWASHGADGFRTMATGLDLVIEEDFTKLQRFADTRFSGFYEIDRQPDFDPYERR